MRRRLRIARGLMSCLPRCDLTSPLFVLTNNTIRRLAMGNTEEGQTVV